ncbi:hypothetical protein [Streptomyces sp. HUAS TT7]|uniref:hypothetical protein n=1 Tax=Streptomyces sp. HUAS TT7 TaxID=3447507 RepID=UPI003F65F458
MSTSTQTKKTPAPAKKLPFRLGQFDPQCRYPVIVGKNTTIGYVSRWHREWDAVSSIGTHRVGRPPVGKSGAEHAAQWLYDLYRTGVITSIQADEVTEVVHPHGPAPLLDPRMPNTRTNRAKAMAVNAHYDRFGWRPVSGYAGSDNHQWLYCVPCGKTVAVYPSHQRGRNGAPPSPYRHPGCLDEATIRALIPAYGPATTTTKAAKAKSK